ncbi:MAG: GntR family transcriptional regulator [Anaerolineaceae bacterium]|nr:GntR family transcriptional regulator [Anaerolineaceae bacterium]
MKEYNQDRESSSKRLQRELGERISTAEPGEKLPPEPELARQMGVSRSTLREVMRTFEAQGLINRRQGAGTFVIDRESVFDTGLEILESLETIADRMGLEVSMGRLKIEALSADEKLANTMGIQLGTKLVSVDRVINAKGSPAAYLRDILPRDMLSQQDLDERFTGSVLDLLIKREDLKLEQSRTEIRAVVARPIEARALHIQQGDVLLMLEANLVTKEGKVVDHSYSYFIPGCFRLHVNRKIGII